MKRRLEGGIIVSRLIDADNLDFTFDRCCFSEGDTQYVRGADDAIGVVNNAPTIDAVPVVRCRECKFYREFRTKRHNQLMRLCYRMGKHDMEYPVKPDDFCSYGQRKEAANEVSEP